MDDFIKKLAEYVGFGVVSAVVLGAIWKFFLKFLVDELVKYNLAKQQAINKAELDKQLKLYELQTKSFFDVQDKYLTSKLQLETVKLGRVFDHLEQINLLFTSYIMNFNSFMNSVLNNDKLRGNSEQLRVDTDVQIIEHIHKVVIYLPEELRLVLNKIRVLISCSWQDPQVLNRIHRSMGVDGRLVAQRAIKIINSYHSVYLDMVRNYCSIKSEEIDYSSLLEKHGFDETAEFKDTDILTNYVKVCIMFHEHSDSSKMMELQELLQEEYKGN